MSPVIYTPPAPHVCRPPMYRSAYGGSVWSCDDCGQRWIVASKTYDEPTIEDHRVGPTARRTWWEQQDKDTP